jgi:plasmid stabilization system protein ParE
MLATARLLASSPRMGRPRPELRGRLRSHPSPPYLIFYRVGREKITVARIVHEKRDLANVFPPRKKRS